jgi:hypothetical protein
MEDVQVTQVEEKHMIKTAIHLDRNERAAGRSLASSTIWKGSGGGVFKASLGEGVARLTTSSTSLTSLGSPTMLWGDYWSKPQ